MVKGYVWQGVGGCGARGRRGRGAGGGGGWRARVSVECGVRCEAAGVGEAVWWSFLPLHGEYSDVSYCRTYFRKWIQNDDGPLDTSAARPMAQNVPLQTGIMSAEGRFKPLVLSKLSEFLETEIQEIGCFKLRPKVPDQTGVGLVGKAMHRGTR